MSSSSSPHLSQLEPPVNEDRRVQALRELGAVTADMAELLQSVAHLLQNRFQVPIALINLVGADTVLVKAGVGLEMQEVSRQESVCSQTILTRHLLVVQVTECADEAHTPVFVNSTLLSHLPSIGFYAGAPLLVGSDRQPVGTLCLMDYKPRSFCRSDRALLQAMAAAVSAMISMPLQPEIAVDLALAAEESVVLIEAETGQLVLASNRRFEEITGFSAEQQRSLSLDYLLCLDRPHSGALLIRHALDAKLAASGITRCRTQHGSTVPMQAFLFPLPDAQGGFPDVMVLLAPLSAHVLHSNLFGAELSSAGSIDDFVLSLDEKDRQKLLAAHLDGLWALDTEGRITHVSGGPFKYLKGANLADICGKRLDQSGLFDAERTDWAAFYASLLAGYALPEVECCVAQGGEFFWMRMVGFSQRSASGEVVAFHGSFHDITRRKRDQQKLLASEMKFRALTDLSSDWYWELDADSRLVYLGDAFNDLNLFPLDTVLGQTPEQISQYRQENFATPAWSLLLEKMAAYQPFKNFELELIDAGGQPIWVEVSGAPLYSASAHYLGYRGVGRDITARKQSVEALRLSEERLALILLGTNDGCWDWDLLSGEYHLSARWWEMMGRQDGGKAQTAQTTQLWFEFIHPDDAPQVRAAFRQALGGDADAYQAEFRMLHKGGHYFPVLGRGRILRDASGRAIRTAGANIDLTTVRLAEEKLRLSEARFRRLTELSSDWYWEQDENFLFTELSGQQQDGSAELYQRHLGKARWELPALNLTEADWQAHRAVLQARQPFQELDIKRMDSHGQIRWVSITGEPKFDADQHFAGYRGVGRDITQKKLTDQALLDSRYRLDLMLRSSNDGAWDWDLENQAFFVSDKAAALLGYLADELNFHCFDWKPLVHPQDLTQVLQSAVQILQGSSLEFTNELRLVKKTGEVITVMNRGALVRNAAGRVTRIAGTVTDLTGQRQAESRLRLLQTCVESLQDVVIITSAEYDTKAGPSIIYVNSAFEQSTGYSKQEVIGKNPRILQGPQTRRSELDRIAVAMAKWQPIRAELANYKKNGELFWIELEIIPVAADDSAAGRFTHWVGVQRDITARKSSEQALSLAAQRLSLALDASGSAMWTFDLPQQRLDLDDGAHAMLGYRRDEMAKGRRVWRSLVHADDVAAMVTCQKKLIDGLTDTYRDEFRMRHKKGHWVWIRSRGKVIERSEDGTPLIVAGTHLDITDHMEKLQQASSRQEQILHFLESMPVGFVVSVKEDIRFANSAIAHMLGFEDVDGLVGTELASLIHEQGQDAWHLMCERMAQEDVLQSVWLVFEHNDGRPVKALVSCAMVHWNGSDLMLTTVSQLGDADLLAAEVKLAKTRYERLLVTQLEERHAHIARELHDSLGSQLAGISLQVAGIKTRSDSHHPIAEDIDRLQAHVKTAAEITRSLARGLVPVDSSPGSFWRALERLCEDYHGMDGALCCEFEMQGDFELVPPEVGNHLYRICQEAITNALRHGKARRIVVALKRTGEHSSLSITDDGCGFDVQSVMRRARKGLGVTSMQARVRAIDAVMTLLRLKPSGMRIHLSFRIDAFNRS